MEKQPSRLGVVDAIRGFAVLGILKMNIAGFAMPSSVDVNPSLWGGFTGFNLAVWWFDCLFADGRMRGLFSMLFGASLILYLRGKDSAQGGELWLRRNVWLVLIGVLHGYLLLWRWDILYWYGLAGIPLYLMRGWRTRHILITCLLGFLITATSAVIDLKHARGVFEKGRALSVQDESGVELTQEQQDDLDEYEEALKTSFPTRQKMENEVRRRRSGFAENFWLSAELAKANQKFLPYHFEFLSALVTMLLGLVLLRHGILSGERSTAFYLKIVALAYGVGLPLEALTTWLVYRDEFNPLALSRLIQDTTYEPLRLLGSLGLMSLVILATRKPALNFLTSRLESVGKMALSCYLSQTILCQIIFLGFGFGLFGSLNRVQQFGVCCAIWLVQILGAPLYLKAFRYGPFEWAWRSLTYWKPQ